MQVRLTRATGVIEESEQPVENGQAIYDAIYADPSTKMIRVSSQGALIEAETELVI